MWFGTQRGLNRWDGQNFRIFSYHAFDSTTLPSSRITSLVEAEDKMLWVGTYDGGLARFDPRSEHFHSYHHNSNDPNTIPDENITALFIDSRSILWVGTKSGLCRYDSHSDQFKRYVNHPEDDESIPDNWITAITEDTNGVIWIGSNTSRLSMYHQETNKFITVKHQRFKPDGAGTNRITALVADSIRQVIWVSMFPQGVFSFHPASGLVVDYGTNTHDEHMVNINAVFDVDLAEDGKLWIGSLNGLTILDPESRTHEFHEPDPTDSKSISGALIFEVYRDPQGIIWTGSDGHGVDIHNPNQIRFEHYQSITSGGDLLQASKVFGLDTDASGNIWAATFSGGFHRLGLHSKEVRLFQTDDTDPEVWSMNYGNKVLVDRQDRVWMSSFEAGLFRWDSNTDEIRHFRHLPGRSRDLSGNDVYAIYEDRSGTIWVGTNGAGLNRYQPQDESFGHYRYDPLDTLSICSDNINVLMEDHSGDLWIGTPDAGLDRMIAGTELFKHYPVRSDGNSLMSNAVHTLFEDSHHCLWIGTRGGGISRLDSERTTFTQIELGNEPSSFSCDAIIEDEHGTFWASSNRGILKIHHDMGLQNTYTLPDGVQGLDFYWNSVTKDEDGYFYFGGVNGFNRFHPDSIHNNPHLPPIRITNLRINHEDVKIGPDGDGRTVLPQSITYVDTLLLTYHDKVLNFSFAALDYSNPGLNRYRYKLDGFDPGWIEAGHVNNVTYTSLDPGWYTLHISGSNNDGVWNETGTSLSLFIKPPFWMTGWFQGLGFLVVVMLGFSFYRIRIQKVKVTERRNLEKQKIQLQLEYQQRQLVSKSIDLIEKQKVMEELLDQLKLLSKSSSSSRNDKTRDLVKKLTSLASYNHVWDEFESWFTKIHSGYIKTLREVHPTLTKQEIKVAVLLRLNLSSKEISRIMNIEPASVDVHRYRIRKKLELTQDESLTSYLSRY